MDLPVIVGAILGYIVGYHRMKETVANNSVKLVSTSLRFVSRSERPARIVGKQNNWVTSGNTMAYSVCSLLTMVNKKVTPVNNKVT